MSKQMSLSCLRGEKIPLSVLGVLYFLDIIFKLYVCGHHFHPKFAATMLDLADFISLFMLGTLGGFISGLLGVGGGLVFIPLLEYYLTRQGISGAELVKFTLANSFFVIVFAGVVISYRQWKANNFFPTPVLYTALTGIISSQFVTWFIVKGSWYRPEVFRMVFLGMIIPMALRMFIKRKEDEQVGSPMPGKASFSVTGFFTGFVTALSGLGGGIIMVPVFSEMMKVPIKRSTSISTGVVPLLTLPLVFSYMFLNKCQVVDNLQTGYIIYSLVAPLIISVLLVAPLGVKMAHKAKPSVIKMTFVIMTGLIILKELYHYEGIQNFVHHIFSV